MAFGITNRPLITPFETDPGQICKITQAPSGTSLTGFANGMFLYVTVTNPFTAPVKLFYSTDGKIWNSVTVFTPFFSINGVQVVTNANADPYIVMQVTNFSSVQQIIIISWNGTAWVQNVYNITIASAGLDLYGFAVTIVNAVGVLHSFYSYYISSTNETGMVHITYTPSTGVFTEVKLFSTSGTSSDNTQYNLKEVKIDANGFFHLFYGASYIVSNAVAKETATYYNTIDNTSHDLDSNSVSTYQCRPEDIAIDTNGVIHFTWITPVNTYYNYKNGAVYGTKTNMGYPATTVASRFLTPTDGSIIYLSSQVGSTSIFQTYTKAAPAASFVGPYTILTITGLSWRILAVVQNVVGSLAYFIMGTS